VQEKAKALELTKRINFHECGGRAQVVTVRRKADSDFNEKDEKRDAASKTFWQLLVRPLYIYHSLTWAGADWALRC
jgi:hypothetical protein